MSRTQRLLVAAVPSLASAVLVLSFALWASGKPVDSGASDSVAAQAASAVDAAPAMDAPPAVVSATPTATTTADPREAEYARLDSVRAGMYIGRFEDAFGTPLLVRGSEDGARIEKTFAGPGYFVQTIQDRDGTVQLMAVTSCRGDFQPIFAMPAGGSVTLSKTLMKDFPANEHRYFVGGTSNTYLYDESYTGNAGGYKLYIAGVDDACNYHVNLDVVRKYGGQDIKGSFTDPEIVALRAGSVINTYAETAPGVFELAQALGADHSFQVGVDRIRVRTLPQSALVPATR